MSTSDRGPAPDAPYDAGYYASLRSQAESSAAVLVPHLIELIRPASVLDVGCGDGTWLDAYRRAGVADVFGVDGGDVRDCLRIPNDRFAAADLTRPLELGRRFDLVQSLEVAEHLPPAAASMFVASLTQHADVILFSAAIPHQGGVGHLHERWPDYWADLFREAGYAVYDCLRPRLWGDERVAWWYAQNTFLFVKQTVRAEWLRQLPLPATVGPGLRLVHPNRFLGAVTANRTTPVPRQSVTSSAESARPFDVAVVIPTILRPSLARAVRSVYAQHFPGTIQILIGVDTRRGDPTQLNALLAEAPANCRVMVFDPGYSTAARHGGFVPGGTGGALRTILTYVAHSRYVAYLDDDNWWAPEHLANLTSAVVGHDWAYSLRWYADGEKGTAIAIDRWESVGPDAGCFQKELGGFVDPSCLLLDRVACEPALRLWCHPLPEDQSGMSTDRPVFAYLRAHGRGNGTDHATAYYAIDSADPLHPLRLWWLAGNADRGEMPALIPTSPPGDRAPVHAFAPFTRTKVCRYGTMAYNVHDRYVGRSLDLYGEFSEGEVEMFRQIVRPGDVVLDIGANIGVHTLFLARQVGPTGMVLALEPQRVLFQTLCANMALNHVTNVWCWPHAAGAAPGEATIRPVDYTQSGNFGGIAVGEATEGERVPVVTVDSLKVTRCRLIKVDVEGAEEEVLRGAAETIRRLQPILYVENDRKDRSASLVRYLAGLGYQMYWHRPPLFHPANYAGNTTNVFGTLVSINMVCVPRGSWRVEGLRPVTVPPG